MKGALKAQVAFTSLIFVAFILCILLFVIPPFKTEYDYELGFYIESEINPLWNIVYILTLVSSLLCVIGTFITGIVIIVKSSKIKNSIKSKIKTCGILAVVFTSICLILLLVAYLNEISFIYFIVDVGIIITFGFTCSALSTYNKSKFSKNENSYNDDSSEGDIIGFEKSSNAEDNF